MGDRAAGSPVKRRGNVEMFRMVVRDVNSRRSATHGMEHFGGLQDGPARRNAKKRFVHAGRPDGLHALAAIVNLKVTNPRPRLNEIDSQQVLVFHAFVKRWGDMQQIPRHRRAVRQEVHPGAEEADVAGGDR